MFAIRDDRDYVIQDDFMKAVRKVADAKKLETKMDCKCIVAGWLHCSNEELTMFILQTKRCRDRIRRWIA